MAIRRRIMTLHIVVTDLRDCSGQLRRHLDSPHDDIAMALSDSDRHAEPDNRSCR
jgi:Mg2+ and Co2+ transporter CorA